MSLLTVAHSITLLRRLQVLALPLFTLTLVTFHGGNMLVYRETAIDEDHGTHRHRQDQIDPFVHSLDPS